MNRRALAIAGGIAVGVIVLWSAGKVRRNAADRSTPDWLRYDRVPDNVAADMATVSPAESWAAVRARPICCASPGYTAGMRTRRVYPETLAADPNSLIRTHFDLQLGGG